MPPDRALASGTLSRDWLFRPQSPPPLQRTGQAGRMRIHPFDKCGDGQAGAAAEITIEHISNGGTRTRQQPHMLSERSAPTIHQERTLETCRRPGSIIARLNVWARLSACASATTHRNERPSLARACWSNALSTAKRHGGEPVQDGRLRHRCELRRMIARQWRSRSCLAAVHFSGS